ncbi:MAG: hypothetical protein GX600_09640, partial [Dehalococcoidia bacterium]|nr:hypothetical protein [Dehalococcoidia bacterium]
NLAGAQGAWFIKDIKGYQQTADHTCGPAALMAVAAFHHPGRFTLDRKTEMAIASEAGSRPMDVPAHGGKPGTTPAEMMRWLETHGFDVRADYEERGDGSALRRLQANITNGIPTIVEWADLGGHWVVAVGYDSRDNDDPWDDVIVFADSFDRYDDHQDGYTFVNANKFYWLWYDAFYFDKLTWRTMITATPRHAPHPGN